MSKIWTAYDVISKMILFSYIVRDIKPKIVFPKHFDDIHPSAKFGVSLTSDLGIR